MNPARSLGATVQRILSYPRTSFDTSICTYMMDGVLMEFTQFNLLSAFRSNAAAIGKDKLGFGLDNIRTHSVCSAAAMAMLMDDTPVYMIMLMKQ